MRRRIARFLVIGGGLVLLGFGLLHALGLDAPLAMLLGAIGAAVAGYALGEPIPEGGGDDDGGE